MIFKEYRFIPEQEAQRKAGISMTMEELKIGFKGFGNMAQAIADGLIYRKVLKPEQMGACAKNYKKLEDNAAKRGMKFYSDAAGVCENSDLVILAVKPYMLPEVVEPIRELLADKIILSVAAGYTFDKFEEILAPGSHHISTVPNTPVAVGEGIFICEEKHSLTAEEFTMVEELLSSIALVQTVPTSLLGIGGVISGCGPAFVSMFIEALADAAVMHGMSRDLAYQICGQMTAGTGKLLVSKELHPGVMKDAVCSPGGTTIVGVAALERKGLRSAVIDAVDAIQNKK